ncbi:MAG: MBL fold metallo-hydrolase [Paracoccus sp. (in: a-proteobacteria)]|nr:MBL fold metallo-hydrolase [Paracoccus sp. (in: a-proteobacteria)]
MIRLRLLRVGSCSAPARLARPGARGRARFPALIAVISHPERGEILFDTGYGRSFFVATDPFPERIYRWLTPVSLPEEEALPQQLARLGVTPDLVILSHLHADHVAGLFDLERVPQVVTSGAALDHLAALGRIGALRAGCPKGLRDRLLAAGIARIEARAQAALPECLHGLAATGHDLLGDGSILTVDLPGHGTGQFGLFLPRTPHGPVLLGADAAWSIEALRRNHPPPRAVLAQLGDAAAYLRSFAALHDLHRARPDIALLFSHCPEAETWVR